MHANSSQTANDSTPAAASATPEDGAAQTPEQRDQPASSKPSKKSTKSDKGVAKPTSNAQADPTNTGLSGLTLGEFAVQTIREQYVQCIFYEKLVIADKDPENLHQMRVWSRRLYTALHVFESVIQLPKAARRNRVRRLTSVLGKLRDLDVQLQALQESYLPHLAMAEQPQLQQVIDALSLKRRKALAGTRDILRQSQYHDLKLAYETWLEQPCLNVQAALPLSLILPDLLNPLLAETLRHPGWLIAADGLTDDQAATLHDLRKACKHVRYQAEFFAPFYGKAFKTWIKGLKNLQETLGKLQDLEVLRQQLQEHRVKLPTMPTLHQTVQDTYNAVLLDWEAQRQPYLDQEFRYGLYRMLLEPL